MEYDRLPYSSFPKVFCTNWMLWFMDWVAVYLYVLKVSQVKLRFIEPLQLEIEINWKKLSDIFQLKLLVIKAKNIFTICWRSSNVEFETMKPFLPNGLPYTRCVNVPFDPCFWHFSEIGLRIFGILFFVFTISV